MDEENFCCDRKPIPTKPYYNIQSKKQPIGFTWHMKSVKNSCSMLTFFSLLKFLVLWNPKWFSKLIKHIEEAQLNSSLPSLINNPDCVTAENLLRVLRSFADFINLNKSKKHCATDDYEAFKILTELFGGHMMFDYKGTEQSNILKYLTNFSTVVLDFNCSCYLGFHQLWKIPMKSRDFLTKLQTGLANIYCKVCNERNLDVKELGWRSTTLFLSCDIDKSLRQTDLTKTIPKVLAVYDYDLKKTVHFQLAYFNLTAENSKNHYQLAHTCALFCTGLFDGNFSNYFQFFDSLDLNGRTLPVPDECCNVLHLLKKWMIQFSDNQIDCVEFATALYLRII